MSLLYYSPYATKTQKSLLTKKEILCSIVMGVAEWHNNTLSHLVAREIASSTVAFPLWSLALYLPQGHWLFFTGLVYLVVSRPSLEQVSTFGCVLFLKSKNIRKTANKETHENYLIVTYYDSHRLKKRSAIPMHMYANLFSRYLSYVWKEGNLLSLYLVKHVLKPSLSLHRVICVASMSV